VYQLRISDCGLRISQTAQDLGAQISNSRRSNPDLGVFVNINPIDRFSIRNRQSAIGNRNRQNAGERLCYSAQLATSVENLTSHKQKH
jgi:hypothetical protein